MPAYLKNPVFPPLEFVLDPSVPRMLEQDFGGMAVLEWTLKAGYMAEGVQVRVDKALTDERNAPRIPLPREQVGVSGARG